MIKTSRKDVIISYISYFLRVSSNILLLPMILHMLSNEEYGLWSIFISIGAIVNLIDIGFGNVLTRYSTYAYCGAMKITKTGLPVMDEKKEETNYLLLIRIFRVAKDLYHILFYISLGISVILAIYIGLKTGDTIDTTYAILSWLVYSLSCCMYIYYVSYNCLLKGMGKIKESYYYSIVQHVVYLLFGYFFLSLDMGILGLSLANLLGAVAFRVLNMRFINRIIQPHMQSYNELNQSEEKQNRSELFRMVQKNTNGLALVVISNYITHYGITFLCSMFLPLVAIGRIGITNQFIGIVGTLAGTSFSVYMSKMGDLLINKKKRELKRLFFIVTIFFFTTYLVGSLCVVFLGPMALRMIGSNTQLLNSSYVLLLIVSSFITDNHQRCTNFIMLANEQPHIKAYIISSVLILAVSAISLYYTHDVIGYILPNLFIHLAYNGWKWPIQVYKLVGLCTTSRIIMKGARH